MSIRDDIVRLGRPGAVPEIRERDYVFYPETERELIVDEVVRDRKANPLINFVIWYLVIAAIVFAVLWLFRPDWVRQVRIINGVAVTTEEIDFGKVLLWSLLIALGIALVIWLFRGTAMC